MRKVLLLGSTGLLGNAFFERLNSDLEISLTAPISAELNLTDFDAVTSFIESLRPEIVINATGYNFVDKAELQEEQELCLMLNTKVPGELARLSRKYDFKFFQFSSDYVFDGESSTGYDEKAQTNPINYYGYSKAEGEKLVIANADKYFIIRISWLFGPGKSNFVTTMINLSKNKSEISVVNDQFGKPTYTKDVVDSVLKMFESADFGIFHLPNEAPVSWYEFAQEIFAETGWNGLLKPISSVEFNSFTKRPKYSMLLNSKLPLQRSHTEALNDYLKLIL